MPRQKKIKKTKPVKDVSKKTRSNSESAKSARKPKPKKNKSKNTVKKGSATVAKTVAIVVVVLLLLFVATETFQVGTLSSISDSFKSFLSSISQGDGYPYRISSSSVKDIDMLSSNLFLLTDSSTISLDSSAKEIAKIDHTYANPKMSISNGRAIVYDRSGNRYMIQSRTEKLYSKETDDKIITCDIGKSGNVAIATLKKDSTSQITVYSGNLSKTIFKWECYSDNIVDIALSDNGKYMAVATIGALDGEVLSKVYVFDFDYSKALETFKYPGTSIFDVEFSQRDTVVAMGDNLRSVIKNKTERQKDENFNTSTLMRYCMAENGKSAVLLSEYGSTNLNILKVYSDDGEEIFNKKIDSTVKRIFCNQNTVSVLLDDKVVIYNLNGDVRENIKTGNDGITVLSHGKYTYIYAIGEIRQYS